MRVLEQARRAYGNGRLHRLEEREEVVDEPVGQLGTQEVAQDDLVGHVAQRKLVQVVRVHELVEEVGAEDHGLRDGHRGILERLELHVTLHEIVDECQSASLAAQRAFSDAGEVGVAVEAFLDELRHDAPVLHPAVLDDGVEYDLPVGVDVLVGVAGDALQELRHGEHGA